jgi:hypothetical protein
MNETLDVSAQQTSLMSPLFVEVPIPSQESIIYVFVSGIDNTHKNKWQR